MYQIVCNQKGSRNMAVEEKHLRTIERYMLFGDLLDSNGVVDDSVVDKLRLNVRSLLESNSGDKELLDLCSQILFHDNMKAYALRQLILLYIDWEKEKLEALKDNIETEAES